MRSYSIFQCRQPECRMRFPDIGRARTERCPRCGGALEEVQAGPNPGRVEPADNHLGGPRISVLLDNLRSAFNVGAILRTADGAGVQHAYLCGITPTPENPKVTKTALSAEFAIPWSQHPNAVDTARELRASGLRLWALEGGRRSESIFETLADARSGPLILVAGNEVAGVDPGLAELCERVVHLPMQGFKGSLNVAIATGIAIYLIRFRS